MAISIVSLAFADLRRRGDANQYEARLIGVADTTAMPAEARSYLGDHLADLGSRSEEYGEAQPGWWVDGKPPAQIASLAPPASPAFGSSAPPALDRLSAATPGTASPGLIALVRYKDPTAYLAILKLDIDEQDLYRFQSTGKAERVISYERLKDVLPKIGDLKKAALVPNPVNTQADLRVVDDEASGGTATYWLNFLGARVVQPAPGAVKKTSDVTRAVLSETHDHPAVHTALGRALDALAKSKKQTTPRDLVRAVATNIGTQPGPVWNAVSSRLGERVGADAPISPVTLERVETEISFHAGGQQVKVKGPAEALEGRFQWEAAQGGYVLRIRSDDEPRVRTILRSGRPRAY